MSTVENATADAAWLLFDAARELYAAELALHDAHRSGIDSWISAAGDHLHRALQRYMAQLPTTARAAA
jgi:hypothetical protein